MRGVNGERDWGERGVSAQKGVSVEREREVSG